VSFLSWGFKWAECEWCVYSHHSDDGEISIIVIHVDDMLAASSSEPEAQRFQTKLEATWQISALGKAKLVVGIALHRDRMSKTIMLSQTTLIDKIVATYGQSDPKPASTPMAHSAQLLKPEPHNTLNESKCECLAHIPYQSLVGSLMYVARGSRPDIMFAVSKLSRFFDCYCEAHWQATVQVVRYLKRTQDFTLQLGGPSAMPSLLGYSDSDYANEPGSEGHRFVGRHCFTLGSGIISWSLRKQNTIANSTCAAKYMAASESS